MTGRLWRALPALLGAMLLTSTADAADAVLLLAIPSSSDGPKSTEDAPGMLRMELDFGAKVDDVTNVTVRKETVDFEREGATASYRVHSAGGALVAGPEASVLAIQSEVRIRGVPGWPAGVYDVLLMVDEVGKTSTGRRGTVLYEATLRRTRDHKRPVRFSGRVRGKLEIGR